MKFLKKFGLTSLLALAVYSQLALLTSQPRKIRMLKKAQRQQSKQKIKTLAKKKS